MGYTNTWWCGRAKGRMARQEGFVKRPLYRKGILCNQDDDEDTRSQEEELHWGKCNEVNLQFSSVQSLSSIQIILTPMDCSTPGFPVHHQTPGACSNSCQSSQWFHPTISSSVVPFSSCPQSFPALGSFLRSQFQSIGTSASSSVLPMNIQDWFRLGLFGLISL